MFSLLQATSVVPSSRAIESVIVGLMLGVSKVYDHFTSKKRERSSSAAMGRFSEKISLEVREVRDEVRDLSAHVIGPDGQNGLRGDVRELKADVKGILGRERDRLNGEYRR